MRDFLFSGYSPKQRVHARVQCCKGARTLCVKQTATFLQQIFFGTRVFMQSNKGTAMAQVLFAALPHCALA